jgi:hypothetical protein
MVALLDAQFTGGWIFVSGGRSAGVTDDGIKGWICKSRRKPPYRESRKPIEHEHDGIRTGVSHIFVDQRFNQCDRSLEPLRLVDCG